MKLLLIQKGKVVPLNFGKAGVLVLLLMGGMGRPDSLGRAATLEQLTLDQMAQQSTEIVRGRVISSSAAQRNGIIYTTSRFQVLERWKGQPAATVDVSVPGGRLGNLQQTFAGAPVLSQGAEYVLFLWTGRSGVTQVIGLSQGVLDLALDSKGQAQVARPAAMATMLSASGRVVSDSPLSMSLAALDQSIRRALQSQVGAVK